jgi:hypothetical protein
MYGLLFPALSVLYFGVKADMSPFRVGFSLIYGVTIRALWAPLDVLFFSGDNGSIALMDRRYNNPY